MKKTNPYRKQVHLTEGDLNKVKKTAQDRAIKYSMLIMFTALNRSEHFGQKRIKRVWDEVNRISDSVTKGDATLKGLCKALEEKTGIVIGD